MSLTCEFFTTYICIYFLVIGMFFGVFYLFIFLSQLVSCLILPDNKRLTVKKYNNKEDGKRKQENVWSYPRSMNKIYHLSIRHIFPS